MEWVKRGRCPWTTPCYIGRVFFILVGIYCIGTGAYALWKKEHKEGTPQEESIGEKKEEEED